MDDTGVDFAFVPETADGPPAIISRSVMRRAMEHPLPATSRLATGRPECAPSLADRAAAADLPVPEALHVKTDIGDGCISLGGQAPPAELSIDRLGLVQLLFGYRTFRELRETDSADARGISDAVLAALFPRSDGYCFWPDRY